MRPIRSRRTTKPTSALSEGPSFRWRRACGCHPVRDRSWVPNRWLRSKEPLCMRQDPWRTALRGRCESWSNQGRLRLPRLKAETRRSKAPGRTLGVRAGCTRPRLHAMSREGPSNRLVASQPVGSCRPLITRAGGNCRTSDRKGLPTCCSPQFLRPIQASWWARRQGWCCRHTRTPRRLPRFRGATEDESVQPIDDKAGEGNAGRLLIGGSLSLRGVQINSAAPAYWPLFHLLSLQNQPRTQLSKPGLHRL